MVAPGPLSVADQSNVIFVIYALLYTTLTAFAQSVIILIFEVCMSDCPKSSSSRRLVSSSADASRCAGISATLGARTTATRCFKWRRPPPSTTLCDGSCSAAPPLALTWWLRSNGWPKMWLPIATAVVLYSTAAAKATAAPRSPLPRSPPTRRRRLGAAQEAEATTARGNFLGRGNLGARMELQGLHLHQRSAFLFMRHVRGAAR